MAVMICPGKNSLLRAAPRLVQILRVLVRHKILGPSRQETLAAAERGTPKAAVS